MIAADGVVRLGSPLVNWYLVGDDHGVTVVDAGVAGFRPQLEGGLAELGRRLEDVRAVVLTHAHADHVGVAEILRTELGVPVYVHEADRELATTAKAVGKNERSFLPYLRHPAAWRLLVHLARNGGMKPRPIADVTTFADGEELDVPGRPVVLHTPGHTDGHCVLHFRGRALLVGDLLCTLNPLTGSVGPQLLPAAFNRSSAESLRSLSRLDQVDEDVLLPGHGEPWREGPAAAAEAVRRVGPN